VLRERQRAESLSRRTESQGNIASEGKSRIAGINCRGIGNSKSCVRCQVNPRTCKGVDNNLPSACGVFKFTGVGVGRGESASGESLPVEVKGALGKRKSSRMRQGRSELDCAAVGVDDNAPNSSNVIPIYN